MNDPMRRLPPLNALRAFVTAARHLNFRRAAEELGVSQGAVAQQIRGLEQHVGLTLFERLPRGLALTEAGHHYAAPLRRAFDLMIEATAALRPQPQRLTLSTTPTFAAKWLLPRLPGFTTLHPDIDLRLTASDRMANFQTDGVDLAVRYSRPPFGSGLTADLLFDPPLVAVAAPAIAAALGPDPTHGALSGITLLHDAHPSWGPFLERIFPGLPPPSPRALHFNQTSLALDAALAGQGIALAPLAFVTADLAAGRLMRVFAAEQPAPASFWLVFPKRTRSTPPQADCLARVCQWLKQEAAGYPLSPG